MKISASKQVASWLIALPPQSKHNKVRLALRELARGGGNVKGLQGPLEGYNRLRIGGKRIIYRQVSRNQIELIFANTRDVVYELFEQILNAR